MLNRDDKNHDPSVPKWGGLNYRVAYRSGESYRKDTELAERVDSLILSIERCRGSKLKTEDTLPSGHAHDGWSSMAPIDP